MDVRKSVETLKAFARASPVRGMSVYADCYEAKDWERLLSECGGSVEKAKARMVEDTKHRNTLLNSAF